jgi:CRP-like cAMP-binding protein
LITSEAHIQHIGIVLCGTVHMLKYDYWGNQTMLAYMGAGEVFGEVFAVQKMNNSQVSFVAATDCQVLFLRAANIIHTCHRACPFHQKFSENMFNLIGQKSVKLMERIEVASKATLREKILAYLSMQAQKAGSSKFEIPLNRSALTSGCFLTLITKHFLFHT